MVNQAVLKKKILKFKINQHQHVIPASVYNESKHRPHKHSSRLLKGADQQVL